MPCLGRPDEIVVGDVQHRQNVAELLCRPIGEHRRRQTSLLRRSLDLLAVLIRAGQEEDVVTHQAMRACDRIGHHRRIRVAEMRFRVDVIDRRADVEAIHDCVVGVGCCVPYA